MKLFFLALQKDFPAGYDCNCSVIVRARDEQHAREVANNNLNGDEPRNCWLDPAMVSCLEVLNEGDAGLILTSPGVTIYEEEFMSDKKEESYLDYDFETFKKQMAEASSLLKKMNKAANYMRWQYEMDETMKEFEREVSDASGWLSSWCG